jgi:1,4-dihydroxy-2-naphthoate octaprenyltransferase
MVLIIGLPDAVADAAVGKRTLVVRLGKARAARLYVLVLMGTYAGLPLLIWAGLPYMVAGAIVLGLPLAAWQGWRLARGDWTHADRWNSLVFWTISLFILTTLATLVIFVWLTL